MENIKKEVIDKWTEIIKTIDELNNYSTDEVHTFLNSIEESEKQELKDKYKESFYNIPNDNTFRLEVLSVLGKLGVTIDVDDTNDHNITIENVID
jgi:hypothetical protein